MNDDPYTFKLRDANAIGSFMAGVENMLNIIAVCAVIVALCTIVATLYLLAH